MLKRGEKRENKERSKMSTPGVGRGRVWRETVH